MSWKLQGSYVENCSCTAICPCTWSGLALPATSDRCRSILTWAIKEGEIQGVDVSGLIVGMVLETPKMMFEGNWRAGLLIDAAASKDQVDKLESVFWGELGGPPTWTVPFITERAGVIQVPVVHEVEGREHHVRYGQLIDIAMREEGGRGLFRDAVEPPTLSFPGAHPPSASKVLVVAPAVRSRVSAFDISFEGAGSSGFTTSFKWQV